VLDLHQQRPTCITVDWKSLADGGRSPINGQQLLALAVHIALLRYNDGFLDALFSGRSAFVNEELAKLRNDGTGDDDVSLDGIKRIELAFSPELGAVAVQPTRDKSGRGAVLFRDVVYVGDGGRCWDAMDLAAAATTGGGEGAAETVVYRVEAAKLRQREADEMREVKRTLDLRALREGLRRDRRLKRKRSVEWRGVLDTDEAAAVE
jgi:hypothetical protein